MPTCEWCHRNFEPPKNAKYQKDYKGQFCSRACSGAHCGTMWSYKGRSINTERLRQLGKKRRIAAAVIAIKSALGPNWKSGDPVSIDAVSRLYSMANARGYGLGWRRGRNSIGA